MKYITSSNLAIWAKDRECQGNFPLLIRRLIQASPIQILNMQFPARSNVNLPGYDGTLEISGTYLYIPNGKSVWEMGSGQDPEKKANKDFDKRTNKLSEIEKAKQHYVFVTPYIWIGKEDWIKSKFAASKWKGITVIDGLKLEEWLETLPSVGSWLSKILSLPQGNTLPLDQFWEDWSNNTEFSFPPTLLTIGREKQVAEMTSFLNSDHGVFSLKDNTAEEAVAFVAACIQQSEGVSLERLFARSIIVDNKDVLRDLLSLSSPMVIIARCETEGILSTAAKSVHHLIIPLGKDVTIATKPNLELPRINRPNFDKALEQMGMNFEERQRKIKNCGLSLPVLRRQLGFDSLKQPVWAIHGNHTDLIPALLVGRWDEQSQADKDLIAELAGEPYEIYIRKLTRWKVAADSPIVQIKSNWRIVSSLEAWSVLAPFVSHIDIQKFKVAFLLASGEINPALEMDIDHRYLANLYGKIPKYSWDLKEGLIESLILIAVYGNSFKLNFPYSGQDFADSVVRELLKNANGTKWCSLSNQLPVLAEASPDAFLTAVEASLKEPEPPIFAMFEEGTDPFFNAGSYHTGLLWALEGLAASQMFLHRVIMILGQLSRIDPGGRLSNRPINSLKEINIPWYRQIDAPFATRKMILEKLMKKEPDVAWRLFLQLLPDRHGSHTSPIYSCRWRFVTELERTVESAEVSDFYSFIFTKLLVLSRGNATRMSVLINFYPDVSSNERAKLLAFLIDSYHTVDDPDNKIWNVMRSLLSKHRAHRETSWALPEVELEKIDNVFALYSPKGFFKNYLYLFNEHWPEFPTGKRRGIISEDEVFIKQERTAALKKLYQSDGLNAILRLLPEFTELTILANTLTDISLLKEEETLLIHSFSGDPGEKLSVFAGHYIFSRSCKGGDSFTTYAWEILSATEPSLKAQTYFFLSLVSSRDVWSLVEQLDPNISNEYWKKVNIWLNKFKIEDRLYAIEKLQKANRHFMLINQVSYFVEELDTDLITTILRNACTIKSEGDEYLEEYNTCLLFNELHKRHDIKQGEILNLEWLYLDILASYNSQCKPEFLFKKLASDPKFFVDLISIQYRPDNKGEDEDLDEEELKARHNSAGKVWKLLNEWVTIPGMLADKTIDLPVLYAWIESVRTYAQESKRVKAVEGEIGQLLARYPRNNELWPSTEIAEVLDSLESEIAISSFETEVINRRGPTVRNPYDGGSQERDLAEYFKRMSNSHLPLFPITSSLLMRLAKRYSHDAEDEDKSALMDELR